MKKTKLEYDGTVFDEYEYDESKSLYKTWLCLKHFNDETMPIMGGQFEEIAIADDDAFAVCGVEGCHEDAMVKVWLDSAWTREV